MQKKSAGSGILIGVGGDDKDVAAKIWGQLVVGLLRNFKNRILEGWLFFFGVVDKCVGQVGVGFCYLLFHLPWDVDLNLVGVNGFKPWWVCGVVEVLQLGCGWGKVGNTVVDPPELGVFGVHGIPVRLLNVNLYTCTEFWRKCCRGSQLYRMVFWQ